MTIDPESRRLIPPLHKDELRQLEDNLVQYGCRDPLVLWRCILVDGHNRYEIYEPRGIKYRTVEVALASREHVLLWIEENQLGRRNLSGDRRAAIAIQERNKRNRHVKPHVVDTVSAALRDRSQNTNPAGAKAARIPERKPRAVEKIEKKAGPGAVEKILSGRKTVVETETTIRRAKRIEEIAALAAPTPLPDARKYPVVLIDPPWTYEYVDADSQAIENQYPTMPLDELCRFDVSKLALSDAVLFLWVTRSSAYTRRIDASPGYKPVIEFLTRRDP